MKTSTKGESWSTGKPRDDDSQYYQRTPPPFLPKNLPPSGCPASCAGPGRSRSGRRNSVCLCCRLWCWSRSRARRCGRSRRGSSRWLARRHWRSGSDASFFLRHVWQILELLGAILRSRSALDDTFCRAPRPATHVREHVSESLVRQVPGMTTGCVQPLVSVCGRDRARCDFIGQHEGEETGQSNQSVEELAPRSQSKRCCPAHRRHTPCWVPLSNRTLIRHRQPPTTYDTLTEPGWKSDMEKQIFLSG